MYQPKYTTTITPIAEPVSGSDSIIVVASEQRFGLTFAASSVERVGDDLEIKAQGCGVVCLSGFYVVEVPPALVLADGTEPPVLAMLSGDIFWLIPPAPDEGVPFYLAFRSASSMHPLDDIGYIQQSTDESDTLFGVSENSSTARIEAEEISFESDFLPTMDLSAQAGVPALAENDIVRYSRDWWGTTGALERGGDPSIESAVLWNLAAETLYDDSLLLGSRDSEGTARSAVLSYGSPSVDLDTPLPVDTAEYCCILSDQLVRAPYDAGADPDTFFFMQADSFLGVFFDGGQLAGVTEEYSPLEPVAQANYEEENCTGIWPAGQQSGQVCMMPGVPSQSGLVAGVESKLEPEALFGQPIGAFDAALLPIESHSEDFLSQGGLVTVFFSLLCSTTDKAFPLGTSGWSGVNFTVFESDQIVTLSNFSNSTELFLLQQGFTGN